MILNGFFLQFFLCWFSFLTENPAAEEEDYRLEVLITLRKLERLDKEEYNDEEREEAEQIYEQRRQEELAAEVGAHSNKTCKSITHQIYARYKMCSLWYYAKNCLILLWDRTVKSYIYLILVDSSETVWSGLQRFYIKFNIGQMQSSPMSDNQK